MYGRPRYACGISHTGQLLQDVKSTMCTPSSDIRVHRGLDPEDGISDANPRGWDPGFPDELKVCQEWDEDGMWDSRLTGRLGMSI